MKLLAATFFFAIGCANSSEPPGMFDGGPAADGGPMDAPVPLWDAIPTVCDWPFEITELGTPPETRILCTDRHLPGPGCDALPEDFPLDNPRPNLPPVHWIVGSCIPVTVDPEVGSDFHFVEEAVEIWNSIGCLSLCYEAPVMSSRAIDFVRRERRVHISSQANVPTNMRVVSPLSGRVSAMETPFIGRPYGEPRTIGGALAALMSGAGFNTVQAGRFRTVNAFDQPTEELTESDIEGLCFVYGDPPYCDADLRAP